MKIKNPFKKQAPLLGEVQTFTVPTPSGDGLCSDDACPCPPPGTVIPRGTGYLYIPPDVVEFRKDARTLAEVGRKLDRMRKTLGGAMTFSAGVITPILVCEQGARLRGLNMEVAAEDARRWWESGEVPLRATPMA